MKRRIHSGKITINFLNLKNKICNILQQYSLRETKYLKGEKRLESLQLDITINYVEKEGK